MCGRGFHWIAGALCGLLTVGCLVWGCAYQRVPSLPCAGLPEEVFSQPQCGSPQKARVCFFDFRAPDYAGKAGTLAARIFYEELKAAHFFKQVLFLPDTADLLEEDCIRRARNKGFDLIIIGSLEYYFEGSKMEPACIVEEIRVIQIRGGGPKTVWHARARESAMPLPSTDYIFVQGERGRNATVSLLMRRNAMKFCNLIGALPPCPPVVPSSPTGDPGHGFE